MTAKERSDKNHDMHRKLWGLLAEHPNIGKETAFVCFLGLPQNARPVGDCYACEEAMDRCQAADAGAAISYCEYCPVIWGADGVTTADGGLLCTSTGSPYDGFNGSPVSIFKDARKEAAWKILALEWRDEHVDK